MKKKQSNTDLYKIAAKNLGVKVERVLTNTRKKWEVLMISRGKKFFLVSGAAPGLYPEVKWWNVHFSGSKTLSQNVLNKLGYKVIPSKLISVTDFTSKKSLCESLLKRKYTYPILIKKDKGQNANDIYIVENYQQLQRVALRHYSTQSNFMVQPILDQKEYRILMVNGKVMLMHSKHNRFITGNGTETIKQLLENIPAIKKDDVFIEWQHHKLKTKPSTILPKGEKFEFHLTKIPTTIFYETDNIPKVVQKWMQKLEKDISASVIGLDVFIPNGFNDTSSYTIIEINSNPGVHYLATDCNDSVTAIRIYEKVILDFFKK